MTAVNRQNTASLSKRRNRNIVLLCLLPFAAFGGLLLVKSVYAALLMPHMPPCILRMLTGLLCPSCGMTHSVFALCRLDIAEALRQNAAIPFAALTAMLYYAELWLRVFGSEKRIIPRSGWFWLAVLCIFLGYAVLRNIL